MSTSVLTLNGSVWRAASIGLEFYGELLNRGAIELNIPDNVLIKDWAVYVKTYRLIHNL